MLPRSERLTSSQFDRAFSHSQSVRHPLVVLRAHARDKEGEGATHAAFVVPKKQGKANVRNRVRRRLRERYRLHPRRNSLPGCDLIFLSTPETLRASNEQLDAALEEVLRRMSKKLKAEFASRREAPVQAEGQNSVGSAAHEQTASSEMETGDAAPPEAEETGEEEAGDPVTKSESEAVPTPSAAFPSIPVRLALTLIRFYQRFISPGLPPSCRFLPTCSHYTYGAIERFGAARGIYLGMRRVCRCHPLNPGGIDPVPEFFPHLFSVRKLDKKI
jgi:uncharacterized protein